MRHTEATTLRAAGFVIGPATYQARGTVRRYAARPV